MANGGFMEGFGNAFASSFNQGMERNARRADDQFKMMYSEYIDRRKEQKQKDMDVSWSKNKAQMLGLPQESWTKLYEWKQSGMSDDDISTTALNGVWKTNVAQSQNSATPDQAAQVAPVGGPQQASTSQGVVDPRQAQMAQADQFPAPVDQQMSASGMAPAPAATQAPTQVPSPQAQPTPQKTNPMQNLPTMKGGLLASMSGVFSKDRQQSRNQERGLGRIAQGTGQTPEQVQATMDGAGGPRPDSSGVNFTPGTARTKVTDLGDAYVNEARAKAAFEANSTPQNKAAWDNAQVDLKAMQADQDYRSKAKAKAEGLGQALPESQTVVISDAEGNRKVVDAYRDPETGNITTIQGEDISGQRIIPLHKKAIETREKLIMDKPDGMKEFAEQSAALPSMARNAGQMAEIAGQNPNVLRGGVAAVAKFITGAESEVRGAAELLKGKQVVGEDDIAKWADDTSKRLASMVPENVRQLAEDSVRFEAAKMRYALSQAQAIGLGSGRDLSNNDIERAYNQVNAYDVPALTKQIADGLGGVVTDLKGKAHVMKEYNQKVKNFESTYGSLGLPTTSLNPEDLINAAIAGNSNDPAAKGWLIYKSNNKNAEKDIEGASTHADEATTEKAKADAEGKKSEEQKSWDNVKPEQAITEAQNAIAKIDASSLPDEEKARRKQMIVQRLQQNGINLGGQ